MYVMRLLAKVINDVQSVAQCLLYTFFLFMPKSVEFGHRRHRQKPCVGTIFRPTPYSVLPEMSEFSCVVRGFRVNFTFAGR